MRILVVPTSKHGGTAEIGRAIARRMRASGIDIDVSQPGYADVLSRYDGFIIGSAVYEGAWLPEATTFIERFADELRERPVWLFSSGLLQGSDGLAAEPDAALTEHLDTRHVLKALRPRSHQLFGGRLRVEDLDLPARSIAAWVGLTDVDVRDWDAIDAWVDTIIEFLRERRSAEHEVTSGPNAWLSEERCLHEGAPSRSRQT